MAGGQRDRNASDLDTSDSGRDRLMRLQSPAFRRRSEQELRSDLACKISSPASVKVQSKTTCRPAVTKQSPNGPRPETQRQCRSRSIRIFALTLASTLLCTTHQSPQQCLVGKLRIGTRAWSRRATGNYLAESATKRWRKNRPPRKANTISPGQTSSTEHLHDLDHVARPKSRQHALATELQAQTPACAQTFCR